jgi:hypothetical protein
MVQVKKMLLGQIQVSESFLLLSKHRRQKLVTESCNTKGLFGSEDMIQGIRISLTSWLGIANFSVWLEGFGVVGDSQYFVWFEG